MYHLSVVIIIIKHHHAGTNTKPGLQGRTLQQLWKDIFLKIQDISPSQTCWEKAGSRKSVSWNTCMEIRAGHYEYFHYKSAGLTRKRRFVMAAYVNVILFLLLWRIFTFCRFGHELLVHSVCFKAVVMKLRVHNFAEPHVILRVKVVSNLPMETRTGSKEILLNLGTRWEWVINFKSQLLYAWERTQASMNRTSVGPYSAYGDFK